MAKAKPVTALDIHTPTIENARIIIQARLDELYSWADSVDHPYEVQDLHNLRIAAKRLRYTLEIFAAVLPAEHTLVLAEVEQIQAELGFLHDSDVMIALLRLCLGSQDGGVGYEQVLTDVAHNKAGAAGKFVLEPALLSFVLDPAVAPAADQRLGLEAALARLQKIRAEQYYVFRQHWYQLKGRDFQHEVSGLLDV